MPGARGGPRTAWLATRPGLLLTGLAAVAGFLALRWFAVGTLAGQVADARLFTAVLGSFPEVLRRVLALLARPVVPAVLAVAVVALGARALRRREWAGLLVAGAPLPAAPLAQRLREESARPLLGVPGYPDNTFPSTHAALGLALVVGLVALWPGPADRRLAWTAGTLAAVCAVGNVSWYAHRPADVLGSALLVLAPAALACALAGRIPLRRSAPAAGRGTLGGAGSDTDGRHR